MHQNSNRVQQIVLFILWPFGSLIYSGFHYKNYFSKNIVWLFAAFYGLTIVIPATGYDAYRYAREFETIALNNPGLNEILSIYFRSTEMLDIYKPLLMSFTSLLTDDYKIFYCFVGLIFGYFYSRNIWFVLSRISKDVNFTLFLFIIAFAFISPLYSVQFIRFSTATQIFIFGVLLFVVENKKSGLIWASASILVHFSFMLPVFVLLIFTILPKRIDWFFVFFLIATFIVELDIEYIRNFLAKNIPSIFQPKVESYTNVNYNESVISNFESTNWYIRYRSLLFTYLAYALILVLYYKGKEFIRSNKPYTNLYCFILFIYGIANILSVIPSGGRFVTLALIPLYILTIIFLSNIKNAKFTRILFVFSSPILILYIIVGIRIGLDTMGIMTFFGNPLFTLFFNDTVPIIEYIKALV